MISARGHDDRLNLQPGQLARQIIASQLVVDAAIRRDQRFHAIGIEHVERHNDAALIAPFRT